MLDSKELAQQLRSFGVGRRRLDDPLFAADQPPPRLGVFDEDDEDLCHEIITTTCSAPGCNYIAVSLLDSENHYNATHRYACSSCKKVLPSPHLLDLHIQETHDSFFAVMAAKKPSYCCYLQECKEKFMTTEERLDHCVKVHKLPRDFRFGTKPKTSNANKPKKKNKAHKVDNSMDVDSMQSTEEHKKIFFKNSKQKVFTYKCNKKFTSDKASTTTSVNMDGIIADLKETLPELHNQNAENVEV